MAYVVTDHMAEAYRRGDQVLVNPMKPPAKGDDVILVDGEVGTKMKAAIRQLVDITDSHWIVKQLSPPRQEKFERKVWKAFRIEGVRRR